MSKRRPNFKLKALRTEHKIKQSDMADMLGIGVTTYNRKENGLSEFTETECLKISKLFEVSPMDIFFDDDVTERTTNNQETA